MKPSYHYCFLCLLCSFGLKAQELQIGTGFSFNSIRSGTAGTPYESGDFSIKNAPFFLIGITQLKSKHAKQPLNFNFYLYYEQQEVNFRSGSGGRGYTTYAIGNSKAHTLGVAIQPINIRFSSRLFFNSGLRFDFTTRAKVQGERRSQSQLPPSFNEVSPLDQDMVNRGSLSVQGQLYYNLASKSRYFWRPFIAYRYGLTSVLDTHVAARANALQLGLSFCIAHHSFKNKL